MRRQILCAAAVAFVAAAGSLGSGVLKGQAVGSPDQGADATFAPPRTASGDPDLQGIWTYIYQVPLERPRQYADKEFFTDEEIARLDEERASLARRDARPGKKSEDDVAGAYNAVFNNFYRTGRRTSLIVDPPDGRMPAFAAPVLERMKIDREYWGALNQATDLCRQRAEACTGAKPGPPSPRRNEAPPSYQMNAINRADNPEDTGGGTRCLLGGLPDLGSGQNNFGGNFRRIVQSRESVAITLDYGQGQVYHRTVPITTRPHIPSRIRQWWGDSRARWEGNTLVVDVTNFTPKTEYQGARENLHLIERFTRTGPEALEYSLTLEDPTTWTRPWTAKQDLVKQPNQPNRIYYEPRCHEGNYGLVGILASARAEDEAYAKGRGPHPATRCLGGPCRGGENEQFGRDPLQ